MRIVCGILAVLMLLFMAVQYNDPDGLFWAAIYGAGALWAGLACVKPELFMASLPRWLLLATLACACAGTAYFWPKTPGWWRQDVWWNVETAREGMGMMILVIVLGIVFWLTRHHAKKSA